METVTPHSIKDVNPPPKVLLWLICFIYFIYKFIFLYLWELLSLNPLIIFSLLCSAFLFVQMALLFDIHWFFPRYSGCRWYRWIASHPLPHSYILRATIRVDDPGPLPVPDRLLCLCFLALAPASISSSPLILWDNACAKPCFLKHWPDLKRHFR